MIVIVHVTNRHRPDIVRNRSKRGGAAERSGAIAHTKHGVLTPAYAMNQHNVHVTLRRAATFASRQETWEARQGDQIQRSKGWKPADLRPG